MAKDPTEPPVTQVPPMPTMAGGGSVTRLGYAEIDHNLLNADWANGRTQVLLAAVVTIHVNDRDGKLFPLGWDPNAKDDTGRIYGALVVEAWEVSSANSSMPRQYPVQDIFSAPTELQNDPDPTVVFVGLPLNPVTGQMRRTRIKVY